MSLLREINENIPGPATAEGGWNVGHLGNHGILLSCDGFSMKLDLDQLNALFDLAEDGEAGEVRDHQGKVVFVEPASNGIVLTRDDDETYPTGILVDLDTLKEIGIEKHEAEEQPSDEAEQPDEGDEEAEDDDTIESDAESEEDGELKEGVKRAFRRVGKKIKRGFRVTSGFRKGRVVSNIKNAFKPRAKARTRTKLRLAARRKRVIRVLKGKRTRKKSPSQRLVKMNKRLR